jgi:hypothetical protein
MDVLMDVLQNYLTLHQLSFRLARGRTRWDGCGCNNHHPQRITASKSSYTTPQPRPHILTIPASITNQSTRRADGFNDRGLGGATAEAHSSAALATHARAPRLPEYTACRHQWIRRARSVRNSPVLYLDVYVHAGAGAGAGAGVGAGAGAGASARCGLQLSTMVSWRHNTYHTDVAGRSI